jgi:hypothetical protein
MPLMTAVARRELKRLLIATILVVVFEVVVLIWEGRIYIDLEKLDCENGDRGREEEDREAVR